MYRNTSEIVKIVNCENIIDKRLDQCLKHAMRAVRQAGCLTLTSIRAKFLKFELENAQIV